MSDQKAVNIEPIRLKMQEESMDVFPAENRIPMELTDKEVLDKSISMGMESTVINALIPYRNALTVLENRYVELKNRYTYSGLEMAVEPFIPQYLGFEEEFMEGKGVFYKKGSVVCFPIDDVWMIFTDKMEPTSFKIDNMLQGFHILKGAGADVKISSYLDAE